MTGAGGNGGAAGEASCAVVSALDSRWRAVPCTGDALPSACRAENGSFSAAAWSVAAGERGWCPLGSKHDLPRHPHENYQLARAVREAGFSGAWLPVHGPEWRVDSWPAMEMQPQPKAWPASAVKTPIALGFILFAGLLLVVVTRRGVSSSPVQHAIHAP